MIRCHWMVENGLHWVLDTVFRDDECRLRTDNAPFNLAIVKHIALNVLRTRKSKDSYQESWGLTDVGPFAHSD